MTLNIRAMQLSDLDEVYTIEANAHPVPWSKDLLFNCVIVGYDCRVLELKKDKAQTIVGFIISRYNSDHCHILNLCIAKTKQSKGYGKYLLNAFLRSFQRSKVATVQLEVRPSNHVALKLYASAGFEKFKLKKDYYVDALGTEDAIVLRKSIANPH